MGKSAKLHKRVPKKLKSSSQSSSQSTSAQSHAQNAQKKASRKNLAAKAKSGKIAKYTSTPEHHSKKYNTPWKIPVSLPFPKLSSSNSLVRFDGSFLHLIVLVFNELLLR
ncbi:hypothetical protein Agabi119p4_7796 [Agaricus bisporus var. burnettii]|uniref:Uncharacterized protein n=1 Tax=Agaricus bisporus var. burnettii TaxID=192524 RepID=A0A8H7C8S4_AGABI|nr:hypothetical protein Agabi119p4_7796 [Agaricus bisporus var. burnettii]